MLKGQEKKYKQGVKPIGRIWIDLQMSHLKDKTNDDVTKMGMASKYLKSKLQVPG